MRAKSKQSFEISVDLDGAIDLELLTQTLQPNSIVAIQSANIETGVIQDVKAIAKAVVAQNAHLHIDATASGARFVKPSYWSTLHFDARSWNGPSGVGVFALKSGARWSNPLPHTKPTRAPNSFSIPLALAAAGALEHWIADEAANSARLKSLIERIRNHVKQTISDVDIAGNAQSTLPNIISLSFLNVSSEQLVAALEVEGFSVASGSACVASALEPSHVLKAMGLLTHGNMRINLNHDVQDGEITKLLALLPGIISKLREN
jgi:cysteine desulfurase